MTEKLELLAFSSVCLAMFVLVVAMLGYFISNAQWQAWMCVFAIAFLGSAVFREVRLRRELDSPTQ
jgi:hypothetical protein